MSEEHYPAKSVGNDDVVAVNITKLLDSLQAHELHDEIIEGSKKGRGFKKNVEELIDNRFSTPVFPKGRTARSLCKDCNSFLGKYDESYLKFFNADGDPGIIKGFQKQTKLNIIKAIYAKFLSVPEACNEKFDFIDFIRKKSEDNYTGKWHLYFVKRDHSTDLMGLHDISTGKIEFNKGVVYELSDDKFIFNLMNFKKHDCFNMTNIFDINSYNYILVEGVGESGGYHGQIMITRFFKDVISQLEESN